MLAQNPYSRLVILLTMLSMVHSFSPASLATVYSTDWDYLLYPKAQKVQKFDTEFNFQKHIVAIQYSSDSLKAIEDYYSQKMSDWGWVSDLSTDFDLGLGENGQLLCFEKGELTCSIILLTNVTDDSTGSLISIEVTDKPAELHEKADVEAIEKEISPIPLFPGATNPIIFKTDYGQMQISVNYETNFSLRHVADFYRRHLERQGYKEAMRFENLSGGEVFQNVYYERLDSQIIVGITQQHDGKTSVLLMISDREHSTKWNRQVELFQGITA